jgi:hypothetical protein
MLFRTKLLIHRKHSIMHKNPISCVEEPVVSVTIRPCENPRRYAGRLLCRVLLSLNLVLPGCRTHCGLVCGNSGRAARRGLVIDAVDRPGVLMGAPATGARNLNGRLAVCMPWTVVPYGQVRSGLVLTSTDRRGVGEAQEVPLPRMRQNLLRRPAVAPPTAAQDMTRRCGRPRSCPRQVWR